jgi:hypothetical protein
MTSSIPHTRKTIAILALTLAAAALAGCENIVYGPSPQGARGPEAPMTRSRAASECWMATEKGRGDMNLDQRADVVTKCIERKMKEAKAK